MLLMTPWGESIIHSAERDSGGYRGGDIPERFNFGNGRSPLSPPAAAPFTRLTTGLLR
jgi:hypothetical protein